MGKMMSSIDVIEIDGKPVVFTSEGTTDVRKYSFGLLKFHFVPRKDVIRKSSV